MAVASRNGGLAAAHDGPVNGVFERNVAYLAELLVPLDDGTQIRALCDSIALFKTAPCSVVSSGRQTAISQQGNLSVEWEASKTPRLAGEYSDVITVTLEFAP